MPAPDRKARSGPPRPPGKVDPYGLRPARPPAEAGDDEAGLRGNRKPDPYGTRARSSPRRVAIVEKAGPEQVAAATLAVAELLADAPAADVEQILAIATGRPGGEVPDETLWGVAPTPAAALRGISANLSRQAKDVEELASQSITKAAAAKALKVSQATVATRIADGDLIAVRDGRRWLIPKWQLDPNQPDGLLPGLSLLRSVFPGSLVALTRWIQQPNADLGDRTPHWVLARGDLHSVIEVASQLTAAGW